MIELSKSWAIGADSCNIILYRKSTPKEEPDDDEVKEGGWYVAGYYSTLHNALEAMVEHGIKDTDMASIKSVNDKIEELHKLISSMPNISVADLPDKTRKSSKIGGG
jgi:hypothetical protein